LAKSILTEPPKVDIVIQKQLWLSNNNGVEELLTLASILTILK